MIKFLSFAFLPKIMKTWCFLEQIFKQDDIKRKMMPYPVQFYQCLKNLAIKCKKKTKTRILIKLFSLLHDRKFRKMNKIGLLEGEQCDQKSSPILKIVHNMPKTSTLLVSTVA